MINNHLNLLLYLFDSSSEADVYSRGQRRAGGQSDSSQCCSEAQGSRKGTLQVCDSFLVFVYVKIISAFGTDIAN